VLYADGGGKVLASPEPLFGAALIARFMAGVAAVRRSAGGAFEERPVRVNGQPGRIMFGPSDQPFGAPERAATASALAGMKAGSLTADDMAELMTSGRDPIVGRPETVWHVLTVDVVDGRIQTVRIVRNPDKLSHL
jgi:RNA polymerase sigma-70 factor (ECF subfamily)